MKFTALCGCVYWKNVFDQKKLNHEIFSLENLDLYGYSRSHSSEAKINFFCFTENPYLDILGGSEDQLMIFGDDNSFQLGVLSVYAAEGAVAMVPQESNFRIFVSEQDGTQHEVNFFSSTILDIETNFTVSLPEGVAVDSRANVTVELNVGGGFPTITQTVELIRLGMCVHGMC